MRKRVLMITLLVTSLCVPEANLAQTEPVAGAQKPAVKCRVWAANSAPSQPPSTLLHVSIKNDTPGDVIIKGIEARLNEKGSLPGGVLHGSQNSYWSLVDPETKVPLKITYNSKGGLTYPEKRLTLEPGKSVEFTLDLKRLEWANELSSGLPPSGEFHAVVEEGLYDVSLVLNGQSSVGHVRAESNKTRIEIHRPSRKAQ